MSMDFQEELFRTIETIVEGKLNKTPTGSYIECMIDSATQNDNGSYNIRYQDTILEAFPISNTLYSQNDIVYVMAVGGDLSKKKMILTLKSKSGEQYVNLANIKPTESRMGINYVKGQSALYTLPSGTSEIDIELTADFIKDINTQTDLIIAAEIESNLIPAIGGDYGISLVLKYEDGVSRTYKLGLNKITGNVYQANGYHDSPIELFKDSKVVSVVSTRLFIKNFSLILIENYVKIKNIKIGFLDKVIADVMNSIAYRVEVKTSNGFTFKNRTGVTTLTAKLFKGTEEADVGANFVYIWTRRNNAGEYMGFSDDLLFKIGKSFEVNGIDIQDSNTFEVTIKEDMDAEKIISSGFITVVNVDDGPEGVGKDANLLDWVEEWDGNKVRIKDSSILSPRIFAGVNEGTADEPLLTGLALGRDVLGSTNDVKGLIVYSKNIPTIQIKTDGWAIFGTEEGRQFIIRPDGSIETPQISITDVTPSFGADLGLPWLEGYMSKAITYGLDSSKPLLR